MDEEFTKTIDTLINASTAIKDIYHKLAILEQTNKKNTKDYYKLLKYLNIMQETEDIYYQKLDDSIKTYYDFVYEYDFYNLDKIDEDIMERISNHLIYRSESAKDKESLNFYNKYFKKQAKLISAKQKLSKNKMSEIEKYIYKLILNTYLYFIELKCKNNKNMIREKYRVFNMYKHMEDEFIKHNFNCGDIYYFDTLTISKYFNINEETYQKYLDSIIKKEFACQIEKLIKVKDKDYEKEFDELKVNAEQCFLRALFTIADTNTIDNLNYEFHNLIDSDKFIKKYLDSTKSIELIINAFKKVKKDRSKVKVLSIKVIPDTHS